MLQSRFISTAGRKYVTIKHLEIKECAEYEGARVNNECKTELILGLFDQITTYLNQMHAVSRPIRPSHII